MSNQVFISYAVEDKPMAHRLYTDLRNHGINPWIYSEDVLPGANLDMAILSAIRQSRYFILLISQHSITKRGYVQKEIKYALKALAEFPADQIFIIPVRLDETMPIDFELQDLSWVEMYRSYSDGLERILKGLSGIAATPKSGVETDETLPQITTTKPASDGNQVFFKQLLEKLPSSTVFNQVADAYHITFATSDDTKTQLSNRLRAQHPDRLTIILGEQYSDLRIAEDGFNVQLMLDGVPEMLWVAFSTIIAVKIPTIGVSIKNEYSSQ